MGEAGESPSKATRPPGRPTDYTPELTAEFCKRITCGGDEGQPRSVRSVCKDPDMPHMSTIFLWIGKHPEFSEQYARALHTRADGWAEEIVDIADSGSLYDTQRARLRVDTRKWLMARCSPRKYGERTQHSVTDPEGNPAAVPVQPVLGVQDAELVRAIARKALLGQSA